MKRTTVILALCCAFFIFAFTGCAEKEKDAPPSKVLISGFESYEEMQTFNYYNKFGRVDVNTDMDYVTSGAASARVEIHGDPKGNMPCMYIWCDTPYFSANDFSYVKAITLDVFNEGETEFAMQMSLTTRKNKVRKNYPATEFLLTKGKNSIVFYLDRQAAKYLCDIDSIEYVRFDFEQPESYDAPRNLLYLDSLEAHYEYTEVEPLVKTFRNTETEKEFFYFEDKADWFNIRAYSLQCSSASFGKLSINSDKKFVSECNKSLKLDVTVNPNEGHPDPWPGLNVEKKYLQNFDLDDFKDEDTLSFDILNAGYKTKTLAWNVRDNVDNSLEVATAVLPVGEWVTVTAKIGDIKHKNGRHGVPLDYKNLDNFQINYAHELSGDSYSFYIDNFKFNING